MPRNIKSKKQNKRDAGTTKLSGKASAKIGKSVRQLSKKLTAPRTKALILVHGAGKFPESDIEKIAEKIKALYGKPLKTLVAYYADWDEKCPVLGIAAESPEALRFKQAFRAELQKGYNALPPSARPVITFAVADEDRVGGIEELGVLTKQVAAYLFNPKIAECIQQRLIEKLKLAAKFDQVVIASHSMGSLVVLDTLKKNASKYHLSRLLMLGGPLGILRRVGVRDDQLGQITEKTVDSLYNIFDTTDIISGAIGPDFPKPGYRIHDIFVEVANKMPEAHDYWHNPESLRLIVQALG